MNWKRTLPAENTTIVTSADGARILLVRGIWLYIILLFIEGGLRKWVLPGLSGPLLIVRDPVAIALMIYAWYHGLFPKITLNIAMLVLTVIAFFTALFIGHSNIPVALYGARILLIHFPFIFLMGYTLSRRDVEKIGNLIVWISIPMALLVAMQFFSPQSAWVNRGIGGDLGGAGFSGAMGFFRPPGTFSFTNGTTQFFGLAACFIFYNWLQPKSINKLILIGASFGLITSIPFSISRSLLFSIVITLIFVLVATARNPRYIGSIAIGMISFVGLVLILGNTEFFGTAIEVFTRRFEVASNSEGSIENTLVDRYLGGLISAVTDTENLPFFGHGLGMGTNAGSALLGSGRTFLISEGEWGRLVGEMGALLGITCIGIRLWISVKVSLASFAKIQTGDLLPWILLSAALLIFPQGQWAQPTTLGFSTVVMGLLLAALNEPTLTDAGHQGTDLTSSRV